MCNLTLEFLPETTNCVSDGLEVYSGTDNTGTLLGKFCGDVQPDVLETQSSTYLYFHTDSSQTGDGFGLIFEEGNVLIFYACVICR